MLEVYGDNQNQATSKTIGFCLYRWFSPSGYNKNPVAKIKVISQPISNADVDEAHMTTLHTKKQRDSDITLVTQHSETITITNNEPQIQELAETNDRTSIMYDTSIDYSVTWDQKIGLDENIKIMCPNPWTTIDPYDVHIEKVEYKNHETARRLRSFSQEHSSHFAKFKIFSIPTKSGKSEHWMAGWAICAHSCSRTWDIEFVATKVYLLHGGDSIGTI